MMGSNRAIQILRLSDAGSFEFLPTALIVHGSPLMSEWEAVGDWLTVVNKATQFWLGDWLIYGEGAYPERFSQALDATRLQADTLSQYMWLCQRIPPDRRRAELSFSHHREVGALDVNDQSRWLQKAVDEDMSHARLRRELAKATKAESRLWVLVAATSPEDAEEFRDRCVAEGRAAKVIER